MRGWVKRETESERECVCVRCAWRSDRLREREGEKANTKKKKKKRIFYSRESKLLYFNNGGADIRFKRVVGG